MLWLNILNNENFLLAAEILFIVIGSMLLGILLSYLSSSGMRTKVTELTVALEEEKKQAEELREQIAQISQIRTDLQSGLEEMNAKSAAQARAYFDQQLYLQSRDEEFKNQKNTIDSLQATIDTYQHKLNVIQEELEKNRSQDARPRRNINPPTVSANFEHVSKLLGKQVTDNDLTLIAGIGPKTATLLQSKGIDTWEDLAHAPVDTLRAILDEAGGVYKSQDPTHWAKQAVMASQGEWRKLRVFQEALKKTE